MSRCPSPSPLPAPASCIRHQVYNTRSVCNFSTAFKLITADGDRQFNLGADRIRYVPPGAPLPLPTAAETLEGTRILDTRNVPPLQTSR